MSNNIAAIKFVPGYVQDGLGKDGLPFYRDTVRIIKVVGSHTRVEYEATPADFDEFREEYAVFQKENVARLAKPTQDGFPLALWPVVTPAQLAMLAARDIFTIETLAKLRTADPNLPGDLRELAERARTMQDLSNKIGKFEQMITERDGQIAALRDQVVELQSTVKAQDGTIANLRQRTP